MNTNDYTRLNATMIDAGMDPAKAVTGSIRITDFRNMCLELGTSPAAVLEAAGL